MDTQCDVLHHLGISLAKAYQRLGEAPLGDFTAVAHNFEEIAILHTSISKHREFCDMCRSVDVAVHEQMQIYRSIGRI